jgi:hypothetical protein
MKPYTRRGPCTHINAEGIKCRKLVIETREFAVSVNMFDPQGNGISPEVAEQLKKWRDDNPLLCKEHKSHVTLNQKEDV